MTIKEFKAFLEGMGIEDAPTVEQWGRIVEKIELLQDYSPLPAEPPAPWMKPLREPHRTLEPEWPQHPLPLDNYRRVFDPVICRGEVMT